VISEQIIPAIRLRSSPKSGPGEERENPAKWAA
jgi:hypothetical protein